MIITGGRGEEASGIRLFLQSPQKLTVDNCMSVITIKINAKAPAANATVQVPIMLTFIGFESDLNAIAATTKPPTPPTAAPIQALTMTSLIGGGHSNIAKQKVNANVEATGEPTKANKIADRFRNAIVVDGPS